MLNKKKGNISNFIEESANSIYNQFYQFEQIYKEFNLLYEQYLRKEYDRIGMEYLKEENEYLEKENELKDTFLKEQKKVESEHREQENEARSMFLDERKKLKNSYLQNINQEKAALLTAIKEVDAKIEEMKNEHQTEWLPFDDSFWEKFSPIKDIKESLLIRVGELQVYEKKIPALLPIVGAKNLIFNATGGSKDVAIAALQSIMLRLLVNIPPGKVNFILIDPVGLGANMAGFMHLPEDIVGGKIWTEPNHIEQQLVNLSTHMETIIQKYLRNNFSSMEQYNEEAGEVSEPYRFLVITNFPANFTDAAAQRLISIASNGPKTGVYTLLLRDTSLKLPYNFNINELSRFSSIINQDGENFVWNEPDFREHKLFLDSLPSSDRVNKIFELIAEESKLASKVEVPFETALKEIKDWWSQESYDGLSTPIGRAGARRFQYFTLGKSTLQHVLVVGKTGSGKSNLLHVIILSLCISYSPDELELYLVDFKKGVEFKPYATMELPHAKVIAIQSEREFGLSLLKGLDSELQRRGDLFRSSGVQNFREFRLKNNSPKLSRIILLVDEFQEFFTEDDGIASQATLLIDRLVRQGRAFGIHLILASQALAGAYMLTRSTTDQMAVRIALQCSDADSRLILGEDNPNARLLSRPGEAIYNDANGLIEGNSLFQVLYLSDEDRERYLRELNYLYKKQNPKAENNQIVFEGNAPARIEKNPQLNEFLETLSPSNDSAPIAWLGEPIAIKLHTAAIFKRQSRSNLLIVGQNEEAAAAMFISSLMGLVSQKSDDNLEFHILDLSHADAPLTNIINNIPMLFETYKIKLYSRKNINEAVKNVLSLLNERETSDGSSSKKTIFFILFGLQRARELKSMDGYTYPDSTSNLFYILSNGPDHGIHTICWGDTLKNTEAILSRHTTEFDLRVAMQMSITESNSFIDSPEANRLGRYRALFYDEEKTGRLEKFRPYALPSEDWLRATSDKIRKRPKKKES